MSEISGENTRICPYCGGASADAKQCEHCRGLFEPLSRQASQNSMGPWFVRDEGNPFRPGCSYATLRLLATRGKIGPDAVVRGPSTRQFWMQASATPGVAHLFGACHSCRAAAKRSDAACSQCGASFIVEDDRQYLGLAEVRLIPGQASAEEIAHAVKRAGVGGAGGPGVAPPSLLTMESCVSSEPVLHRAPEADMAEPIPMLATPEIEPGAEPEAPVRRRMSGEDRLAEFDRMRNGYDRDSGRGGRQRAMLMVVLSLAGAGAIMVIVMWVLSVSAVVGKSGATPAGAPLQAGVPMNTTPPPIAPGPTPNPQVKKP